MSNYHDELVCDLAQYYHIYDYKSLPPVQVATYLCGLDSNSRVVKKMCNSKGSLQEILLALIFDRLNWLCWANTKDGHNNINRPTSIAESLMGRENSESNVTSFASGEDFEEAREKIIRGEGT